MSEKFVRFDIGECMFCYDVCNNQLLVDTPECMCQLSIFIESVDIIKLYDVLDKIEDWFSLQDEITTLGSLRFDIEDTCCDDFYNVSSTIIRLESTVIKIVNEIEEALQ